MLDEQSEVFLVLFCSHSWRKTGSGESFNSSKSDDAEVGLALDVEVEVEVDDEAVGVTPLTHKRRFLSRPEI